MNYRSMEEKDIDGIIPLYIDYYNGSEGGVWTDITAFKRIHQVWSTEGAYCTVLEDGGTILGFAMGYFQQYDDLTAYELAEILIRRSHQKRGLGAAFMRELERRVKAKGAAMIELISVNDAMHARFYEKLGFSNADNLILKTKMLV